MCHVHQGLGTEESEFAIACEDSSVLEQVLRLEIFLLDQGSQIFEFLFIMLV